MLSLPEVSRLPLSPVRLERKLPSGWDLRQRIRSARAISTGAVDEIRRLIDETTVLTDGAFCFTIANGVLVVVDVRDLLSPTVRAPVNQPGAAPVFPRELLALPALSFRGPGWYFILHADKRHDRRDWSPQFRAKEFAKLQHSDGKFLIHAAQGCSSEEFDEGCMFAADRGVPRMPDYATLPRGGIVGLARFVGYVTAATSDWFIGPGAIEFADPKPLPFLPCRGAPGFFFIDLQSERMG